MTTTSPDVLHAKAASLIASAQPDQLSIVETYLDAGDARRLEMLICSHSMDPEVETNLKERIVEWIPMPGHPRAVSALSVCGGSPPNPLIEISSDWVWTY